MHESMAEERDLTFSSYKIIVHLSVHHISEISSRCCLSSEFFLHGMCKNPLVNKMLYVRFRVLQNYK